MVDPTHIGVFKTRLRGFAPREALLTLARQLRDGGSSQLELYFLFSYFQQRLSPEDPRYDAVVDTMDLIWGGGWAKGRALYDTELTSADVARPGNTPGAGAPEPKTGT